MPVVSRIVRRPSAFVTFAVEWVLDIETQFSEVSNSGLHCARSTLGGEYHA